jgi:hypothetical protein
MATYKEQLQGIVAQYRASGGRWPATAREMAAWAYAEGKYRQRPGEAIKLLAEQISRMMHDEYYTDPQGRRVRTKHAARKRDIDGEQRDFWDDIRTASSQHFELAIQQKRRQMVGEAFQMKTDVDSFNDNRRPEKPIQLNLNLTNDVAERELEDRGEVA